jgi:hypothetical protein
LAVSTGWVTGDSASAAVSGSTPWGRRNAPSLEAEASPSVRGLYVEAHGVYGGVAEERGWGIAARVSF